MPKNNKNKKSVFKISKYKRHNYNILNDINKNISQQQNNNSVKMEDNPNESMNDEGKNEEMEIDSDVKQSSQTSLVINKNNTFNKYLYDKSHNKYIHNINNIRYKNNYRNNNKIYSNDFNNNKKKYMRNRIDQRNNNYNDKYYYFKKERGGKAIEIVDEKNESVKEEENTENETKKYNEICSDSIVNSAGIKMDLIEQCIKDSFIGNDKLSDRIIISYFDINHPNVKIAAQKYFISKYGLDEITLIYIYQTNPNDKFCHKFKLISEINELFIKAKNEKNINPRLYMKSGKEIKNNSKIKCIGALNLDNNSIIKII